jgi:hypothetical protein
MSVLSRCFRRFAAVLVGAVLALALIAVPAAMAQSSTTIQAQAGVQFSGVVDSSPECSAAPTGVTINWGDNSSSSGTYDAANNDVTGTHTYAAPGAYTGSVVFTGGTDCETDTLVANVAEFSQCPPVDENGGCQFLITVSNSGETVVQDPNEGPYEGSDDSLIGVLNNSSSPIYELPLSVPNSDLFGFDGDGICNPGSPPFPSGCVPTSQTPAGEACDGGPDEGCAFPTPTATNAPPAGYVPTGYEGPTSWFSNISPDTSSGVVDFSPPLQPGQSTYFSLEEPPTGSSIGVGGAPFSPGGQPPTVTSSTGASFSGTVYPNGSATTAYFQYGIVLSDRAPGDPTTTYYQTTPVQAVGSDFSAHIVTASVTGLVPNAVYNVQLVATNPAGTTYGPNESFTTLKDPAPPAPVLGKSVNVTPVSGVVFIKPPPGKSLGGAADKAALSKGQGFVPLTEARQIPSGSQIDALHGSLRMVTATGKVGKTQNATISGGIFKLSQARSGISKGLTNLNLVESAFQGAPSYTTCKAKHGATDATVAALSTKTLQLLKVSAKGKFKTTGRYSSATVRGTAWTIADKCNGTLTHVIRDTVLVDDFVRHKTILLHAGQSYLAKKP